jgi:hypothetical protein
MEPKRGGLMNTRIQLLSVLVVLAAVHAPSARAQKIQLKTVPVATGDQFLTLPSERLGMAGVSIAIDDVLNDLFVNPAKGALLEESTLIGAPTFYGISDGNGAGRTLPLTALFRSERSFGAISFALQEIEGANEGGQVFFTDAIWIGPPQLLDQASSTNVYANGVFGREVGAGGLSVGASISFAALNAVDGVDDLYALSTGVEQSGYSADYRVGVFSDRDGRNFEALLLYSDFSMTHDVTYVDWFWDPDRNRPIVETRLETNLDRTRTWGLHLGFAQPLTESGWRVGGILTGNRKSHPKIPNYEIMNIPRDPGVSWAYDLGVGIAKTSGPATFGIDVIVEPIWSNTWVEAEADTVSRTGKRIDEGERTIENEFFFTNVHLRIGLSHETERTAFQIGVGAHSYDYALKQRDNIEVTFREQDESWMEWTPSLGAKLKFPEFEVGYVGRVTTGSGRPGVRWDGARAEAALDADFIIAPSGPLTLQDARVLTHQVMVSIPIR